VKDARPNYRVVVIGGVVVSVLAISPKFCGFKPVGGEIKPEAPCRKILRHVKELYEYEINRSWTKCSHFLRRDHPDLLLDGSACRIARERSGGRIVGTFPQSTSSNMVLHVHILLGNEQ
jgi:hypothetical protein